MLTRGRFSKVLVSVFLSISVLTMVAVSGCVVTPAGGLEVKYSVDMTVVDGEGNPIQGETHVYELNGVLSNMSQMGSSKGYGRVLVINGSGHYEGGTWPVSSENYMVFGASPNGSLLDSDWDKRKFDPGNAGYWVILNYDDIAKHANGSQNVMLHVNITISTGTGKMMGPPQAVTYGTAPTRENVSSGGP